MELPASPSRKVLTIGMPPATEASKASAAPFSSASAAMPRRRGGGMDATPEKREGGRRRRAAAEEFFARFSRRDQCRAGDRAPAGRPLHQSPSLRLPVHQAANELYLQRIRIQIFV